MKKLISLLMVAVGLIGCSKDEYVILQSLVESYYEIDDIEITRKYVDSAFFYIEMDLNPKGYTGQYSWNTSNSFNLTKYKSLCEKHGDTFFNRRKKISSHPTTSGFSAPAVDFVSIDIVSDADYDEQHPAGSNLGDIVQFYTISPYKYIKSGYKELFDWDNYNGITGGFFYSADWDDAHDMLYPVFKMVCDLIPEDLILVKNELVLRCVDSPPTISKIHNITITLTADDGRVYEKTVELNFQ